MSTLYDFIWYRYSWVIGPTGSWSWRWTAVGEICTCIAEAVSRKSGELFGPEKPVVKLRPAYSVKLVFSYVVKGLKVEITAKFRASRRLRFEDTKRIISLEMRPKSFGTFEKGAPGLKFSDFQFCLSSAHMCDDLVKFISIQVLVGSNAFTQILLSISADVLWWWVFRILTCIHQSWRKKWRILTPPWG